MTTKVAKKPASNTKPGSVNGLREIATQLDPVWHVIINQLRATGKAYGFLDIETPIIEEEKIYIDFFKDQPGALEKIIFTKLGAKSVAFRTSVLPSILRYYLNQKVYEQQPISKWLYVGNVISQDERQAAHSDYEFGFEVLGAVNHLAEAQVISAMWTYLSNLGLPDVTLEINMLGDSSVQASYQNILKDYLKSKDFDLCEDCLTHLQGRVLNVLRCNQINCQLVVAEAPSILDYLDESSKTHFTNVLEALDELGIPYQLNQYYAGGHGTARTNFVIKYTGAKEPIILGEGAYHDMPTKVIPGKQLSAFGFVGNLNAIAKALKLSEVENTTATFSEVFLVPLGELAAKKSLRLFRDLINNRILVYDHFGTEGVKNQLKTAQECKAPIALIMGQKEAMDDMVILRDVKSGMQEVFSYDKIIDEVTKRLGK